MRSLGQRKSLPATSRSRAAPTMIKPRLEHSWSWGESNPRPSRSHRPRYDRSRDSGLEGNRSAGSAGPKPYLTVFPVSQRSFPAGSGLSHRPSLLLLPGCSDQAPRDLTARSFPLYYLKSGGKSEVSLVGASVDALFYESEQLGSHERLLVSTSKPVSPEVENPSRCRFARRNVALGGPTSCLNSLSNSEPCAQGNTPS